MIEYPPNAPSEEKLRVVDTDFVGDNDMEEGVIYCRENAVLGGFNYKALKNIGEYNYLFNIYPGYTEKNFGINFKTREAEYAVTNMTPEQLDEIFVTIKNIVDEINSDTKNIDVLSVMPHESSYTVEEIMECKRRILSFIKDGLCLDSRISEDDCEKIKDKWSKDDTLDFLADSIEDGFIKGHQILDKYIEIFGLEFPIEERKNKSKARNRLFKILLKKHMPDWGIEDDGTTNGFNLHIPD